MTEVYFPLNTFTTIVNTATQKNPRYEAVPGIFYD